MPSLAATAVVAALLDLWIFTQVLNQEMADRGVAACQLAAAVRAVATSLNQAVAVEFCF